MGWRSLGILACYLLSCVAGILGRTGAALAQVEPDSGRPTVRLASPFAGPVWRLDIDAAEKFAVTSNAAKAVTIWPLANTQATFTVRVPLQKQERKRAHAVAISPNAELVAYSVPPLVDELGYSRPISSAIYVIRRATGKIVHVLDGASGDIATRAQSLKFSPDGVHLAAVLSSGCGVRVWAMQDAKLVYKDDTGYGGVPGVDRCCRTGDARCDALPDTTGVHFLKPVPGRPYLITSGDSGVRVYDKAGETVSLRKHATPGSIDLERPAGIAVSPSGDRLLVGDRRDKARPPPLRLRLAIIDPGTLRPLRRPLEIKESALLSGSYLQGGPDVSDMTQTNLERVAWVDTGTGQYLFGAGAFPCEIVRPELVLPRSFGRSLRGMMCIARWSSQDLDAAPRFIPVETERVIDVAAMPRHSGLLVLSQRRVVALDVNGEPLIEGGLSVLDQRNTMIDLRDSAGRFRISADGRTLEIEDYRVLAGGQGTVTFDLAGPSVRNGASDGVATIDPDQAQDSVPQIIQGWRNVQGRSPRIGRGSLERGETGRNEIFRAVSVLRHQKRLVLASSESIRLVDYSGPVPRVLCRERVTEDAYRVNITPDGKLILSGHSDGTLRWWRVHERSTACQLELLVTTHLSEVTEGRWTWAAWRPNGLYSRDMSSDLKLEWQRTLKDGQVGLTDFHRLLLLIDREAVRRALNHETRRPSSEEVVQAQAPDEDVIATEQRPEPLIEVANLSPNLIDFRPTIGLLIGKGQGWPKRLQIKLRDETPLAKTYKGRAIVASDNVVIEQADTANGKIVDIAIDLPVKARLRTGTDIQLCFFIDGNQEPDSCYPMKWMGEPAPALPRRLWTLFIAVSKASEGSGLDLRFPENDAIDVARVFIDDYERRAVQKTSPIPPDFARIQVDFAVSATPDAAAEIAKLAERTYVTRRGASKADIAQALQRIAQSIAEASRVEPADDLFLMTYSGHGIVDPNRSGGSAFLTVDSTGRIQTERDLKIAGARALTSQELLHLLRQIPARKLIIVDACRSLAQLPVARPFSPELMRTEFERHSLDTHFFFSSDVGQEAFELAVTAFDLSRPKARQGNGLFTYALLAALTTPRNDVRVPNDVTRIEIPWVAHFLQRVFFDSTARDSPVNLLRAAAPASLPYVPTPRYIPARSDQGDQLIRTLEPRSGQQGRQ